MSNNIDEWMHWTVTTVMKMKMFTQGKAVLNKNSCCFFPRWFLVCMSCILWSQPYCLPSLEALSFTRNLLYPLPCVFAQNSYKVEQLINYALLCAKKGCWLQPLFWWESSKNDKAWKQKWKQKQSGKILRVHSNGKKKW